MEHLGANLHRCLSGRLFVFADFPPNKGQASRKVFFVSLFVGTRYPDFDVIFKYLAK